MGKDKIRIGIIGAGNIAQSSHIPAYLKHQDVELTAICDINKERAAAAAEKFSIKNVFTDYQDLLLLESIDAVSICTLNDTHAPAAVAAANAKKHILCEKPMSTCFNEAVKMLEAVEKNNVVFMMGMVNRFRAESKLIKMFADSGMFGEIYHAKTSLLRRRGTPLGWFTNMKKAGGGPVIDLGVHIIDLTWYLMGRPRPVAVSACTYSRIGNYKTKGVDRWEAFDRDELVFETEDSANGMIRFQNGASMNFEVSWAINGRETGLSSTIYGTKAGADLNPVTIFGEEENFLMDSTPVVAKEDIFDNEISEFIYCLKSGKQPEASIYDGLQIQKILDGIYASARSGMEIRLE